MTLTTAAVACMPESSWVAGPASSSVTTTRATRRSSRRALSRSAAWRMRAGSSMTCTPITAAIWPKKALRYFSELYKIEREARELHLDSEGRRQLRQQRSKPIAEGLREWLTRQRGQVPDGSATMKAIDYSLGRWAALVRYLEDGDLPIDNNHIENRIRPVALGRSNWLFAGSLRAGKRAAAVMSLIQSAKLNGHDPYHYLKDVLERLPTQPASRLEELLPHRWQASHTH